MFRLRFTLVFLCAFASTLCAQQCSQYGNVWTNSQTASDKQQHTGNLNVSFHNITAQFDGNCSYAAQSGTNECAVSCYSSITGSANEYGTVTSPDKHVVNADLISGQSGSNGAATTCGGQIAGAVRSCLSINPSCNLIVTVSGSLYGLGGSVSYSSSPLWKSTLTYPYTCSTRVAVPPTPCSPEGTAPYLPPDVGAEYVWDYTTCSWVEEPCSEAGCSSPIVIDTLGTGFHMTSAAEGVKFDFYGDGRPIQIAWTEKGSGNGWLALPKNGKVTSARDLFGNLTPQSLLKNSPPNGFSALAVYDSPTYGGDNNGVIDSHDAIWSKLRVWIDVNHDGISQPGELHTLEEVGVQRIRLNYSGSPFVDKYGNQFRYKGNLIPVNDDDVDRKVFDVFLVTK